MWSEPPGDNHPGVEDRLVGVEERHPVGAEDFRQCRAVVVVPGRLHVHRDSETARAFDRLVVGEVGVRQDESPVANGVFAVNGFVGVEKGVGGGAAGGVGGHLPSEPGGQSGDSVMVSGSTRRTPR